MERKRQMERMKRVRQTWRGLDYQEVKKKWPHDVWEDSVGRDEKRMREDEKGGR